MQQPKNNKKANKKKQNVDGWDILDQEIKKNKKLAQQEKNFEEVPKQSQQSKHRAELAAKLREAKEQRARATKASAVEEANAGEAERERLFEANKEAEKVSGFRKQVEYDHHNY